MRLGLGEMPILKTISKLMLIFENSCLGSGEFSRKPMGTLERLAWMLKQDVDPNDSNASWWDASGDLLPSFPSSFTLIRIGESSLAGEKSQVLKCPISFWWTPNLFGSQRKFSLINGTQFMAAFGVKVVDRLSNVLETPLDINWTNDDEGLNEVLSSLFSPELHQLRPSPVIKHVATNNS